MSEIVNLEPRIVWEQFDAITQVPRPSKKEGKIIEFLVDFARKHNIEYKKDAIGNVVMRKPATPGFEDRPAVILQSHMDMVCEKNSDVEFDFEHDAIRTRIDGEWVKAEGTTLGADCGIGMAAALAVMLDETVEHGPVEALFTVDEETGLTGAFELGEGMLTGKYLVNLDSEDEGEIFIGCAGGIDTIATFHYTMEPSPKNYTFFRVDVSDLRPGPTRRRYACGWDRCRSRTPHRSSFRRPCPCATGGSRLRAPPCPAWRACASRRCRWRPFYIRYGAFWRNRPENQ